MTCTQFTKSRSRIRKFSSCDQYIETMNGSPKLLTKHKRCSLIVFGYFRHHFGTTEPKDIVKLCLSHYLIDLSAGLLVYLPFNNSIKNESLSHLFHKHINLSRKINTKGSGFKFVNDKNGNPNSAIEFAGNSNQLPYLNIGNLGATPKQGSICFWANPQQINNYRNIFSSDIDSHNDAIRLEYSVNHLSGRYGIAKSKNPNMALVIGQLDGKFSVFALDTIQKENEWVFMCITWDIDQSNVKFYLNNGNLEFDKKNTMWPKQFTNFVIGGGFASITQRYYKGIIDEFRIYNKVLETYEIQELYNDYNNNTGINCEFDDNLTMSQWEKAFTVSNRNDININGMTIGNILIESGFINNVKVLCTNDENDENDKEKDSDCLKKVQFVFTLQRSTNVSNIQQMIRDAQVG